MRIRPYNLIKKKRDGAALTAHEVQFLVKSVVDGSMADYQAAAWLMAAYLNGLTGGETHALTLAMRDSGRTLKFDDIHGMKLDKHSSGGVGDKTTLAVIPILAAAGIPILKMSGRGLGFSGGTIDKLEAIPGFRTDLSIEEAHAQVKRIGAAIIGQSPDLVPADKKLYALRDVTATVESIPLIAASIMSKKLAGGADAVLLDVKVGRGAFMRSLDRARELAHTMVDIGRRENVRTVAALTAMDEPLGRAIGNALEVAEAAAFLTGSPFPLREGGQGDRTDRRFSELCRRLAAHGLRVAGKAEDDEAAAAEVDRLLTSGAAAKKLEEIIEAQGGDPRVVRDPARLPAAPVVHTVRAELAGTVQAIDAERLGNMAVEMGAGRARKEDSVDPAVGIVLAKKTGDRVEAGEPLGTLHLSSHIGEESYARQLRASCFIARAEAPEAPVIYEFID